MGEEVDTLVYHTSKRANVRIRFTAKLLKYQINKFKKKQFNIQEIMANENNYYIGNVDWDKYL